MPFGNIGSGFRPSVVAGLAAERDDRI